MAKFQAQKYIIAFVITAIVFGGAVYTSNYFLNKRTEEVKSIEDKISVDILSSETQFDLLKDSSCKSLTENPVLSTELNTLSSQLSYMEQEAGTDNSQVTDLKRYYSLLEIKDYLLMQEVSQKCNTKPISIIYFYSNTGNCPDCEKEGYVLTYLREQYPTLRVYSFDYNLDLSAVQTLVSIDKLSGTLPALVIGDQTLYGFQSIDDLQKAIPALKTLNATSTTATTTITTHK